MTESAEQVDFGKLANEQERDDSQRDSAGHGVPVEPFETRHWGGLVVSEQLGSDLGHAAASFPHGSPSPRSQGDRLEGGDDNRLIFRLIGAAERLYCVGRSDRPAEGRQELRDVEPTNKFAGSGNRGIERREAGAAVGDEQAWRSKIPVGDPGVMELA